jgi:carnosine N-methyltransferase
MQIVDCNIHICPRCRQENTLSVKDKICCNNCNTEFPIIDNIPILVKNPTLFLTTTYYELEKHIQVKKGEAYKLELEKGLRTKELRGRIINAIEVNNEFMSGIKQKIKGNVDIDYLCTKSESKDNSMLYVDDFSYFFRDWGIDRNNEVDIIYNAIINYFKKLHVDKSTCLFLGAGAGRLMWEIGNEFEKIFAVDSSLTMPYMLNSVLKSDFQLFDVNYKNIYNKEEVVVPVELSKSVSKNQTNKKKIFYSVSDAQFLPLSGESISCMFSIFFTDVLPIDVLIGEVKRVLKKDGIFIHFGPLQYHFSDVSFMYSMEELQEAFKSQGFDIIHNEQIITDHLQSESILSKKYKNSFFIAKRVHSENPALGLNSVIKLHKGFDYSVVMNFKAGKTIESHIIKTHKKTQFQGSELLLEVLKLIDDEKTLRTILDEIKNEFGIIIDKEDLFPILKILIEEEAILVE